jgi:anaerobic magnesium-protoporphyrin IX monomethyl ester cyclase
MLFHPLGIAQLAAVLRRDGLDVSVVDCTFRARHEVLAEVAGMHPRLVGIYAMVSMADSACAMARELRPLLPEVVLVCGGPLPTLKPEQFSGVFNLVFRGEADRCFGRFCRDYLESGCHLMNFLRSLSNLDCYPGLYGHQPDDGSLFETPVQSSAEEHLNGLPLPDRTDYDHHRYQAFWMEREGIRPATIMTTYGCPHNCDFCSRPVFGRLFRRRAMTNIREEIYNVKELGYDSLWIADDCFTLDPDHLRAFCRQLVQKNMEMRWSCLSRVDTISGEDVELMRQAGCRKVYLGLESGDDSVLKMMNKKVTVETADRIVRLFFKSGIQTAGFFMVGYPGETYETIEKTFAWALCLPLDEISFTVPYPLPGTPLAEKVVDLHTDLDWRHENENRFLYQSEFNGDYIRRRIEETYAQFDAEKQRCHK